MKYLPLAFVGLLLAAPVQAEPLRHPGAGARCAAEARSHVNPGRYLDTEYFRAVLRTRMWSGVGYPATGPTEVQVRDPDNVDLVYGWHEGGPLRLARAKGTLAGADAIAFGCLTSDGQQLNLRLTDEANPQAFTYVGPVTGSEAGLAYFSILFKGCFRAEDGGSWCFAPGELRLSEGVRRAELILDASESPGPGSVLRVEGDRMLWVFRPRGTGWAVFRSDWASAEGYVEPDWNKPWRILTPLRIKKNAPKRP